MESSTNGSISHTSPSIHSFQPGSSEPVNDKAGKLLQRMQEPEFSQTENVELALTYHKNFNLLMQTTREEVSYLKSDQGKLESKDDLITSDEEEERDAVIQQTYRQTWGRVIDAQHGFKVIEQELKRLNDFRDQLVKIAPHILQVDPEKPLAILSQSYGKTSPHLQTKKEALQKKVAGCAEKYLQLEALSGSNVGSSAAQWVKSKEDDIFAMRKMEADMMWASEVAEYYQVDAKPLRNLSAFNEILGSQLNILLGGRMGIPLALKTEKTTTHAFAENKGSLQDFLKENGQEGLALLDLHASQRCIFAEFIMRNADCHSGNILIGKNNEPIPIDFGKSLSPINPIEAAYLNFPCLDTSLNLDDFHFYRNLQVEEIVTQLEKSLKLQFPQEFDNPTMKKVIYTQLELLKARLITIQEAVRAGFNQRQLIALELPPISNEMYAQIKEQAYNLSLPIKKNCREHGFQLAWQNCFNRQTRSLNTAEFCQAIQREIAIVQKMDKAKLYRPNIERVIYQKARLDLTEVNL